MVGLGAVRPAFQTDCVRVCTLLLVEIGTRELRANLAAALRQVGAGERLVITVDGRPVAQLGPLEPAGSPTLADLASGRVKIIDLTNTLNEKSPYWPGDNYTPFELKTIATIEKDGVL